MSLRATAPTSWAHVSGTVTEAGTGRALAGAAVVL
ncbi:carboxypeptidase-like regulatory domain-containing protein [Streptomyces sp. Act143]|nr:carboxypeptidase-like regulatory domain-containing protein [Streptomyces sp. Act143]